MYEHDATATATATLNANWYCIRYSDLAPAGLPPLMQAARVLRYSDHTGTWIIALWDNANQAVSTSILRVPAEHVMAITQHDDMGSAAQSLLGGS